MKVSEISDEDIYQHLREFKENLDDDEKKSIKLMKESAISYVKSYTGLKDLDAYEDITIAILVLISDMWNSRTYAVDKTSNNIIVEKILSMHSLNLLPNEGNYG